MIDRSITTSITNTRSRAELTVAPKRDLKSGNFLYELIVTWNKYENLIEGTNKLKELKYKINEIHNKVIECNNRDSVSVSSDVKQEAPSFLARFYCVNYGHIYRL